MSEVRLFARLQPTYRYCMSRRRFSGGDVPEGKAQTAIPRHETLFMAAMCVAYLFAIAMIGLPFLLR